MPMNNGDYWKARMSALSDELYEKSEKYHKDVKRQYDKAMHDIERDISVWYQRIADNNGISYAAAKELLKKNELKEFKWSVDDYIKAGEENAVNKRWIKELENASARYHISRLEAMKIQIRQRAELAAAQFGAGLKDFLGETYSDQYYHTAFEIMRGIGIGHNLARIDDRTLDTVLKKPWAQDGKVFSDRIWEDKERLVNNLHAELTQGLIRGDPPQRMIDNLSKRMGVSRSNAGRLIMTETAAISARATQDSYKELDVEEFQVLETLDSRTCMICRDMDGRHFPMSDYEIGVTVPPFHPRCRGTTIPYFDDEFTENEMRAARDENDEGYVLVPAGMTYKDWKKTFVDGGDKSGLKRVNANDIIIANTLILNDKQFGKKTGKHAIDFGLNPSKESDRAKILDIIRNIFYKYDEVRIGEWRGQAEDVLFYIKNEDVVVTKQDGTYITILKGGVTNERVKNSRK